MGIKKKIVKKGKDEIKVSEVFELFRAEKKALGRAEQTIRNYEDSLKRFLQVMQCDDLPIVQIIKLSARRYYEVCIG